MSELNEIKMYRTENLYNDEYGIYNCFVACESKELAFRLIKDHIIKNHKKDLDDSMLLKPTKEMIHEVPTNIISEIYYTE